MNEIEHFLGTQTTNNRRSIDDYHKRCDDRGWSPEAMVILWGRSGDAYQLPGLRGKKYQQIYGTVYEKTTSLLPVTVSAIEFKYMSDAVHFKLGYTGKSPITMYKGKVDKSANHANMEKLAEE